MRPFPRKWLKRRFEAFEQFTVDVIYDRRDGRAVKIYGGFLRALSSLFSLMVQTRFKLYRNRIFRQQHLGCLVVVVGNLTVGGTGKTPVVEKFARTLAERGRKVAILSRGYKSKKEPLLKKWWRLLTHSEPPKPKVVRDENHIYLDSDTAGDEPYMLARNLPGIVIVVDKNRVRAGNYAIEKYGVDTLILDDGFQYFPLKEQLNLLLIDKSNPFGNHHLLPRGILREPIKHLKRASYIFITKSDGVPDPELDALIKRHKPDAEPIECCHAPKYLQEVNGDERMDLTALKGRKVAAFSGIAVPESFENFLRGYGAEIRYNKRFLDHHRFRENEIMRIFESAKRAGVDFVVTTEKDAVRLKPTFAPPVKLYFLRLEIEIMRGANDFEEAVSRMCFPKKKMAATRIPFLSSKK